MFPMIPIVPTPEMCASGRNLAEPRLSPDGTCVVVHVCDGGGARLVRIDLGDEGIAHAGPELTLTYDPPVVGVHPSGGGSWEWTPDGAGIVYVAKTGLFIISSSGGPGRAIVLSGDFISSPTVSGDGTQIAYVVETDAGQSVWIAHLDGSAPPRCVAPSHESVFRYDPTWRPRTHQLHWQEWRAPDMPWDASAIGGTSPVEVSATSVGQPRWSPDGARLGYVGDATGFMVVTVDDSPVLAEPFEHATPTWGSGQRSWCWSPDGKRVALVRNECGYGRLVIAHTSHEETTEIGKAWHIGVSWSVTLTGRNRIAAIRTGGVTPAQLVVYDLAHDKTVTRTVVARGPVAGWEQTGLVEPTTITWATDNGTELHGRLYVPSTTGPAPLIVSIHGGPTDQNTVQFNARFAYWLSKGWAIFVPDYRGSTGHGRAYQQAMNHGWGVVDVADVVSGIESFHGDLRINALRIVLMGGSAGGFTVLHLAARNLPGVVGAIALYPVTDLAELDATTHRFERTYNSTIVGPPSIYSERSPITSVAKIKVPLLLLHGDADPVVNVEQSRALVAAIQTAGGIVDYVEYPDEGHGWRKGETTADELRRIDAFLAGVSGVAS
jgi:dipeptidyl aminopeptidase/acylaminoacyl peptidase